jgi:hypothetical protein
MAANKAILKVNALPVMSETTIGAQDSDSLTTCLNKVKESDIYILILGGRYGWQPNGKESITELEYQIAKSINLSIYVFNTLYPKEPLQEEFKKRVENFRFRKTVSNAFELEDEIEKVLREEIEKQQNEYFNKMELVYSNLVKINFPQYIYLAELNIEKNEERSFGGHRNRYNKKNVSLFDKAVSMLHERKIKFSHDWILDGRNILTFHDLQDRSIPLTQIIDRGTVDKLACDEYFDSSPEKMSSFKYLLKKCLETKLFRKTIHWFKEEALFAFIPTQKDEKGRWLSRTETWTKTNKKATRTVADVKMYVKNEKEFFNIKSLAFKVKFEYLDNEWFLSLKPEWIFLRGDLRVNMFAYKNIQWLKKVERNMHVFNHFNFILNFLQPSEQSLFSEYDDYPFLSIGQIEKFDFTPIIPDNNWANLEEQGKADMLKDENGNIGLFGYES